jgi:Trk K+ transport system NAD-binding subunit
VNVTTAPTDRIFSNEPIKRRKRESRKLAFLFYEAFYGPAVLVRALYKQLLLLMTMFVWGAIVLSAYNGLPWLSAFLASVSTITTIGLYVPNNGNFITMPSGESVLLIIMIVVSVGAGASIVETAVSTVISGDLAREEAQKHQISKLKDHVIVFGYGHLGKYVTQKLDEIGFDYVVLTRDPNLYHDLIRRDIFAVLEIEAHPIDALKHAGIENASTVVVSHTEDASNMMVVLSARKLRSDIRIITVVHDEDLIETAKNAGADMVIPASVTVGHMLALSAVTKDLVGVVFSEQIGTKETAQFSIFKRSPLIGKGLQEVSKLAAIIGVVRDNQVIRDIYGADFTLKEADTLLVLGDPANLLKLEEEAKAV